MNQKAEHTLKEPLGFHYDELRGLNPDALADCKHG